MPIGFMVRLATIGPIAEGRNKQGGGEEGPNKSRGWKKFKN